MLLRFKSPLKKFCTSVCAALLALCAFPAHALVNADPVSDERFATEYPWAVSVVNTLSGGICGGTLIGPRWVLTAAHCAGSMRHVMVGSVKRDEARRVEVARRIRHPGFSIDTLQNDIALLYLEEAVDVEYARLPTPTEARLLLRGRVSARIIGWGKTESSAEPVNRLHEAQIYLEEFARAGSRFAYTYKSGPCGRDSGSALQMRTLDGRWLVMGVASATEGNLCSKGGGRAVYTNVGSVLKFVAAYVQ